MKYEYFSKTRCPKCGNETTQLHSVKGYGIHGRTEYTRCPYCPNVYESRPNCFAMRKIKDEDECKKLQRCIPISLTNDYTVAELTAELQRRRTLAELTTEELERRLKELTE